jgi:putative methyltransferase (TIGR04325 family)
MKRIFSFIKGLVAFTRRFLKERNCLEYAPQGWETEIKKHSDWDNNNLVDYNKKEFASNCCKEIPFYARMLSVLPPKKVLSILDFGGGLGHYYQITKIKLLETQINFNCIEMPSMAKIGKLVNPDVHWYTDESYAKKTYDLVMVNGSLQYMREWQSTLKKLADLASDYMLISRLPVAKNNQRGYVAMQIYNGAKLLIYIFSHAEILQAFGALGFDIVEEAIVEDPTYVRNAPEQFEVKGWILKRSGIYNTQRGAELKLHAIIGASSEIL